MKQVKFKNVHATECGSWAISVDGNLYYCGFEGVTLKT